MIDQQWTFDSFTKKWAEYSSESQLVWTIASSKGCEHHWWLLEPGVLVYQPPLPGRIFSMPLRSGNDCVLSISHVLLTGGWAAAGGSKFGAVLFGCIRSSQLSLGWLSKLFWISSIFGGRNSGIDRPSKRWVCIFIYFYVFFCLRFEVFFSFLMVGALIIHESLVIGDCFCLEAQPAPGLPGCLNVYWCFLKKMVSSIQTLVPNRFFAQVFVEMSGKVCFLENITVWRQRTFLLCSWGEFNSFLPCRHLLSICHLFLPSWSCVSNPGDFLNWFDEVIMRTNHAEAGDQLESHLLRYVTCS